MPLILSGNVASAIGGGYNVDNSLRLNAADDAFLSRAVDLTQGTTSQHKFTISCWFKIGSSAITNGELFGAYGSNDFFTIRVNASGAIDVLSYDNAIKGRLITNELIRDPSAWYNLVFHCNTNAGSGTSRMRLYLNGTEITSFATDTHPSSGADLIAENDDTFAIGKNIDQSGNVGEFDGYIAEFVYIDNDTLEADSFGEFDEDSPTIWKPIDVSGITQLGNTFSFYLQFKQSGTDADSSGLGADTSGNDSHFTCNNLAATDQATDTPTNNFCTMNPLMNYRAASTFSEGNCYLTMHAGNHGINYGTFALTAGKWYFEAKLITNTTNDYAQIGISDHEQVDSTSELGEDVHGYGYTAQDGKIRIAGTQTTYGNTFDDADIIGVILNLDDNEIKFSKNSTIQNSGTAQAITAVASTANGFYLPAIGDWDDGAQGAIWAANFGGCSAFSLSSAANDENGYGNFEYAPPSGFLAICTKNLGSDGG